MSKKDYDLAMIGLGVMGRNLVLNIIDQGFSVAGYDKDEQKVHKLVEQVDQDKKEAVLGAQSLEELVDAVRKPRAVMMLLPAGPTVDKVIQSLQPLLEEGDLIIDGGNSHFVDTDRRAKSLDQAGIDYLGVGISGGEMGARYGPSMMPGGPKQAYQRVAPILEPAAAQVGDEPCVTYLGPGSAGHYVKMVHNGIEYGLMELIAETYDLMKNTMGMNDEELHSVYDEWNQNELNSYLMEITANIFHHIDQETGKHLIDLILAEAEQKGTGMWASQDAMNLGEPLPTIDVAVAMRNMSAKTEQRKQAAKIYQGPGIKYQGDKDAFQEQIRRALYMGAIITYAQGLAQLRVASDQYDYNLDLADIARIWRGGCIIRAALLEDIRQAYHAQPNLPNLLLDKGFGEKLSQRQGDLRFVVNEAVRMGIPVPGLMTALAYYDSYRRAWSPANLIQAQRDYFGAHQYERLGEEGKFHTQWQPVREDAETAGM
jgi:6-phosphogluconate dehydrogenase